MKMKMNMQMGKISKMMGNIIKSSKSTTTTTSTTLKNKKINFYDNVENKL
jgi:hypothetical protein